MNSRDYWNEHRKHQRKKADEWRYCPECQTKQFHIPTGKCLMCGFVKPKRDGKE